MVTQPEDSRKKQKMVLISTGAVTLVLALIVLFAAFSPPSPEGVVSAMLDSLAGRDFEALEGYVSGSAREELLAAAESLNNSRWREYWDEGGELFAEYRIGTVTIQGSTAEVEVLYGPGQIQSEVFILRKIERRWKVCDYNK